MNFRSLLSMIGLEPIDPETPDSNQEPTDDKARTAPPQPPTEQNKKPSTPAPPPEKPSSPGQPPQGRFQPPEKKQTSSTYIRPATSTMPISDATQDVQPRKDIAKTKQADKKFNPTRVQQQQFTDAVFEEMRQFQGDIITCIKCPPEEALPNVDRLPANPTQCLITSHGYLFTNESNIWNSQTSLWVHRSKNAQKPIRKVFTTPVNTIRHLYEIYENKISGETERTIINKQLLAGVDDDSPTKKRAFRIIDAAFKSNATDIHFDTEDNEGFVWFRINSLLIRHETMTRDEMTKLLMVLYQVMQGSTSSTYKPAECMDQATIDGDDERVSHLMPKLISRLRCQFRPVGNKGGALVMRINGKDPSRNLTLSQIGYSQFQIDMIENATYSPSGLIWITGPTGCGKSMTAKTVLEGVGARFTENQRLAIMTIEDPREYDFRHHIQATSLPGSKTSEEHKAKFAKMIAVLLRSNPDINFFGETRTGEVLELTFQSAETGHLTFSTLHVNSTHGIFTRELGMKAPEYHVYNEDILRLAIAQRLISRVCPHCAQTWEEGSARLPEKIKKDLAKTFSAHPELTKIIRIKSEKGCEHCKPEKSGENGREAICEVLKPDAEYMRVQKNQGESTAVKYWKDNMSGISFAEHGIYKMLLGMFDPRDLTLKAGNIPESTTPERIEKIIQTCSQGTESAQTLIERGPAPRGQYHPYS